MTGNSELLEAAYARPQILQSRGRPKGTVTAELHSGFLGMGRICDLSERRANPYQEGRN